MPFRLCGPPGACLRSKLAGSPTLATNALLAFPFQRQGVQVTISPAFTGHSQLTVPFAMAPLRVLVAKPFHTVDEYGLQ